MSDVSGGRRLTQSIAADRLLTKALTGEHEIVQTVNGEREIGVPFDGHVTGVYVPARNADTLSQRLINVHGATEVWTLTDTSGSVALASVNANRNGVYSGVSLADAAGPGILSGDLFGRFDGIEDYVNIYTQNGSDGLADIFDGNEIAVVMIAKKSSYTYRDHMFHLGGDGSINFHRAMLQATASVHYRSDMNNVPVYQSANISGEDTDWHLVGMRASLTDDLYTAFIDDGLGGGGVTSPLGTYQGGLSSTYSVIGARTTAPQYPWNGWLGMVAFFTGYANLPSNATVATIYNDIWNGW